MSSHSQKGILQKCWAFIISIRLTIALLFILSVACIIGTIIPQKSAPQEYLRLYGAETYRLFKTVGFTDLFGAWWFQLVMGIFTVNLTTCTLNRLPRVLKTVFRPRIILDDDALKGFSNATRLSFKSFSPGVAAQLEKKIASFVARPRLMVQSSTSNFFAQSGTLSRLGPYITHSGLLIIILGSLAGNLGYKGYLQLVEGSSSNVIRLRDTQDVKKLDFTIRCDKFEVTFYDKTQRPKDYKSHLAVLQDGKVVLTKIIEVNDPLIYHGVYFYQSNYGIDRRGLGDVVFMIKGKGSTRWQEYRASVGGNFTIDGTGDVIYVDRFLPDFSMNADGKPFSRTGEMRNPAVQLRGQRDGQELFKTWLFARYPDFHSKKSMGYDIKLANFFPKYYTGLQVTWDPGVEVVWAGCILMVAGICISIFLVNRRLWVRVEENNGVFTATVAGAANKNRDQFKLDFKKFTDDLQQLKKMT